MRPPPVWALRIAERVLRGQDKTIELVWMRFDRVRSTGYTAPSSENRYKVVIAAGHSHVDRKLLLLHELAHVVSGDMKHTDTFWDTAWGLYDGHHLPIRYTLARETNYRKSARGGYDRLQERKRRDEDRGG